MSFSKHTSRIYMDSYDVEGAIKVLNDRINDETVDNAYYTGAMVALQIILEQEEIKDQSVFIKLFELNLYEMGLIDNWKGSTNEEVKLD